MNYSHLSQEERYFLSTNFTRGRSIPEIAREMGRSPSTLYRERRRNLCSLGCYTAANAQSYATARRRRSRRGSHYPQECWTMIYSLLKIQWSPEQISNCMMKAGSYKISFQTIYRTIRKDRCRGGYLHRNLRIMPKRRRKRYGRPDSRGVLAGKRLISERPKSIETRKELGHWEGDTVMGNDQHQCVLTLVERKSGLARMVKLNNRTAALTNAAIFQIIKDDPKLFKTITFDNGTEFHSYREIETNFPVKCYFTNPHHPWERGTNENYNGLLRQYLPKRMPLDYIGPGKIKRICDHLNLRPRKRLGYKSPQEIAYG